jgi:ABC-type polysaccharide/polyol phosphate export permease
MTMITSAKHLAFHGTLVLLFGLLLGAPYGKAINRGAPAHIVNSWRVAHQSLPIAAILMFSVAALLPSFSVPSTVSWVIAGCLIVSSYFFCVSMPLAAITGHRGLTRGKTMPENIVLVANIGGAWLSLIATLVLVYAAAVSL